MSDVPGFPKSAWWLSPDPKAFEKAHEGFLSRRCGDCKEDLMTGYGHDRERWLCATCIGKRGKLRKAPNAQLAAQIASELPAVEEPDVSDPFESWED